MRRFKLASILTSSILMLASLPTAGQTSFDDPAVQELVRKAEADAPFDNSCAGLNWKPFDRSRYDGWRAKGAVGSTFAHKSTKGDICEFGRLEEIGASEGRRCVSLTLWSCKKGRTCARDPLRFCKNAAGEWARATSGIDGDRATCRNGKVDDSIAACTRILDSAGLSVQSRADAYVNRGIAYADKFEHRRAIADYVEAIRLNPDYDFAYYKRGESHASGQNYGNAFDDFDRAISLDPEYADYYAARGHAHLDTKDYGRARDDFNEVIRLEPKEGYGYRERGRVYFEQRDYKRALADLNQAIRLSPRDPGAFELRSLIHDDMGRRTQARADCRHAYDIDLDEDFEVERTCDPR